MKKFVVLMLVGVLVLSGCSLNIIPTSTPAPVVDFVGTTNAMVQTSNAQTLTALPSPTAVPPSETPLPPTIVIQNTDTPLPVAPSTETPIPNLTTTPFTATPGPADNPTSTATIASIPGSPTATATLGILTYGTLPPANNPYTSITLVNKSKTQAYISLQVVTDQGYTIIEYPVKGSVKVKIPTGDYTYVVWVGGVKFVGYFHVGKDSDLTIVIYKDKVEIK